MTVLQTTTFIEGFAASFVASGIFQFATDAIGAARKTWNGEKAKKELVKALENYTNLSFRIFTSGKSFPQKKL